MHILPSKGEVSTLTISNIRLSKLRRFHFVDVDDNDVGSLEDITFSTNNLIPKHLILGSNFFEELLEEMGERANIDEIAPFEIVSEISKEHVILSKSVDDLERTTGTGEYLEKYQSILYSQLQQYQIFDDNGISGAELIDVDLNGSDSHFIFNYTNLKSKLAMEGYGQRFEIAVLISDMKLVDGKIIISTNEEEIVSKTKQQHEPKQKGKSTVIV